jgi:hypothetical protein
MANTLLIILYTFNYLFFFYISFSRSPRAALRGSCQPLNDLDTNMLFDRFLRLIPPHALRPKGLDLRGINKLDQNLTL